MLYYKYKHNFFTMTTKKATTEERVWAAASYLWILSLVALAARNRNEYIGFHARQGVLLALLSTIFWFLGPIGWFLNVAVIILAVAGIYKAWTGEYWRLPIGGALAQQFGDWIVKKLKL